MFKTTTLGVDTFFLSQLVCLVVFDFVIIFYEVNFSRGFSVFVILSDRPSIYKEIYNSSLQLYLNVENILVFFLT